MRPPASSDCDGFWKRPKYFPSSGEIQLFPFFTIKIVQVAEENFTAVSVIVDILSLIQVAEENFTAVSNLQELSLGAPLSQWFVPGTSGKACVSHIMLFNKSIGIQCTLNMHKLCKVWNCVNQLNWYVYIFPLFWKLIILFSKSPGRKLKAPGHLIDCVQSGWGFNFMLQPRSYKLYTLYVSVPTSKKGSTESKTTKKNIFIIVMDW